MDPRMYYLSILLCFFSFALQAAGPIPFSEGNKINVQNSILAKVNGTTISMIDVKKKMDLLFHQNYAHLESSSQARYQFYETSWRHVLMEMVDHELILADAADREIKVTDAEVREELERRFGPNVMGTLDKVGLTYEEAWRLLKNDLVVQRMTWWFVHSRALEAVKPQEIRQAFKVHLKEHPGETEWHYRVLTIRGEDLPAKATDFALKVQEWNQSPESLQLHLKTFEETHPGVSVALSPEYAAKDRELSDAHREALLPLSPGVYSSPLFQKSRDKKEVCRIFYLSQKTDHPAPTFEEVAPVLKHELLQKASVEVSKNYLEKLRKQYRFDAAHLEESLPSDFKPFSIQ